MFTIGLQLLVNNSVSATQDSEIVYLKTSKIAPAHKIFVKNFRGCDTTFWGLFSHFFLGMGAYRKINLILPRGILGSNNMQNLDFLNPILSEEMCAMCP